MATNPLRAFALLCMTCLAVARPSGTSDEEVPKWRMYFTNDTVTGGVVPCTDADRFCLARGLLLYEPNGKCYLYGDRGPCQWDEHLRVDKTEFLYGSGRVRAACVKQYLCGQSNEFRMAYDGSCLGYSDVLDLCYAEPGLTRAENLFGETECSCANERCPVKQQPVEIPSQDQQQEGACAVPALRDTQLPRLPWAEHVASTRAEVPCSETERRCFLDGRVYVAERDLCFELWRQGPCADGHWLLLDREEAVNGSGRLVGVCEALPCGAGRVLSMADGSCQTPDALCGAYGVAYDLRGAAACSSGYDPLRLPTLRKAEGLCRYPGPDTEHHPPPHGHAHAPPRAPPACPHATTGYCERHVHAPARPR